MGEMLDQEEDFAEEMEAAAPRPAIDADSDAEQIAEAGHSWRFQPAMCPTALQYVARLKGLEVAPLSEPFAYCEIGCRNGVSSNLLAAALPHGSFTAIDPKPEHIANGKRLAKKGGLDNIDFIQCDYDALPEQDLPKFDYIALDEVYSSVSPEARRAIVAFLDQRLKPAGLVYLGYNAMPGWTPMLPLRDLMMSYTSLKQSSKIEAASQGLRYLKYLHDNQAAFFRANPGSIRFLAGLLRQEAAVVADEYLNDYWQPLYFSNVAADMSEAGLAFCGSSQVERNYMDLIVPKQYWELLDTAENELVREIHKSLILNEALRRDVYCKQTEALPKDQQSRLYEDLVFGANRAEKDIKRELRVGQVNVRLAGGLYDTLIPILAKGGHSLGEITKLSEMTGQDPRALLTAVTRLVASGQFRLFAQKAVEAAAPAELRIASDFNRAMLHERLLTDSLVNLASPVLGSGVAIDLVQGLLLWGYDVAGAAGAVDHAMGLVEGAGFPLQARGQIVQDTSRLRPVLEQAAALFRDTYVPLLTRLGIVEAA